MRYTVTAAAAASLLAIGATGSAAFARSSEDGDSWVNDMQRNPRFIEPYADQSATRYRVSNPDHGWYDRQRASGRVFEGQPDIFAPFGRVEVAPYRPIRP